jgi:hypothetical protein
MAINPANITTIRVDQLANVGLTLDSLFPHTVGTDLTSSTIESLVTLVASAIGSTDAVGFLPISVTDGQQLPDVPTNPGFFLCGAGTYLNINGFANLICTEALNAIMSVDDHWEIAVQIPVTPLSGTVQTVTGSAVDNTDPLNPVVNLGSSTTPTLQEVTTEGNETTDSIIVTDGIDTATLSKTTLNITDGVAGSNLDKLQLNISDGVTNQANLTPTNLFFDNGIGDVTEYHRTKITANGTDYPLPTGASSQIATLADITGGGGYTVVSANQTAVNDTNYTVVANATFTDPSPAEGKGYVVYVRNGTATIGGTGYGVGSLVFRVFHSGAWSTRVYLDQTQVGSATQTALDLRLKLLINDNVNSSAVTGVTTNTILKSYLIPANTLALGDTLEVKAVCSKTGTNANCTFRLYTNTSASLSGASQLATISPTGPSLYFSLDRTYSLKSGGTLQSFPVNSTGATDEASSTSAISDTAFDRTVDNYFIVAIQPNNASDSFVQSLFYMYCQPQKTTI